MNRAIGRALHDAPEVARGRRRPSPCRRSSRAAALPSAGLTLVEVLVALTAAVLLFAAVAGVMGSARAARSAEEAAVEPWRALDLAAELLVEEVGLAGFEPLGLMGAVGDPAVVVSPGPAGHSVTVEFVDDRVAGPAVTRQFRFEAGEDARGQAQLYRTSGAGSRQPLVEGVAGLVVEAIVDTDGRTQAPEAGAAFPAARALVLRLAAVDGQTRPAVVLLGARPTVEVRP